MAFTVDFKGYAFNIITQKYITLYILESRRLRVNRKWQFGFKKRVFAKKGKTFRKDHAAYQIGLIF